MRFRFRMTKSIVDLAERRARLNMLYRIFEQKTPADDTLASESAGVGKSEDSSIYPLSYSTCKHPQNQPNLAPTLTKFFEANDAGQTAMFDMDFGGDTWD